MEKARIVFESFNMAIEESFNRLFEIFKPDEILKFKEEDLDRQLKPQLDLWYDIPIEQLEGQTPREYFSGIGSLESALEVFKVGAMLCDEKLPDPFTDKMRSYGEEAVNSLLALASEQQMLDDEENILIPLSAIHILGEWREEKAVVPLIDVLISCEEDKDIILEAIERALANIGPASAGPIIEKLQNRDAIGYVHETLVSALSSIGMKHRSDDIFKCLKNSFIKMDNKVLGAVCLADYGDGRAIPALRGYVEKNRDTIGREIYRQIKAAVESLGGNMDDLNLHFEK